MVNHPSKPRKETTRTTTRPVDCRAWVTIRCAGEEREGFKRRDLCCAERSDALPLGELKGLEAKWRCSAANRGQQRDEDETSSKHS